MKVIRNLFPFHIWIMPDGISYEPGILQSSLCSCSVFNQKSRNVISAASNRTFLGKDTRGWRSKMRNDVAIQWRHQSLFLHARAGRSGKSPWRFFTSISDCGDSCKNDVIRQMSERISENYCKFQSDSEIIFKKKIIMKNLNVLFYFILNKTLEIFFSEKKCLSA